MNFSCLLLAVVLLAFAHVVVAAPVDPIAQASYEPLIIRTKRCDIYGRNCYIDRRPINRADGGSGDRGGTGGQGGNIGNVGLPINL